MIFVFGSNLAGVHGAGAAAFAWKYHDAILGCGVGPQGNSYGIPTKDWEIKTLPLDKIKPHIIRFMNYAYDHPELEFKVTRIGCGLAGYTNAQIAPMFESAPDNCLFDKEWKEFLPNKRFWS